ncbi:MAG: sulfite exporter TauE/SafE family protein, partial [Pseudolabrys sp.]
AQNMPPERLRLLLALLILAVGLRFGYELISRPANLYSIRAVGS